MLGRLATWLRIAGCDVVYDPGIDDNQLIDRAAREERIVLTRDTHLIKRKKVRENAFFVTGDSYKVQLASVLARFGIDPYRHFLSRCLRCNQPLAPVQKLEIKDKVPPYVFETQSVFLTCSGCGRIYWAATHKERMEKLLREILTIGK